MVDLKQEKGLFVMRIRDDGKGMDDSKVSSGQGLYNMRLRAGRLKASLEILSVEGVTIILSVRV